MPEFQETANKPKKLTLALDRNILILAVLTGTLAGGVSSLFFWMLDFFANIFSADGLSYIGIPAEVYFLLLPLLPMIGGLIVGGITRFFPHIDENNGVHAIIHSIALKDCKILKRTIFSYSTTSSIIIGSGGSAGRHGPMVQMGSAIGSALGQIVSYPPERLRILVGCGAAAGIAASFNSPLFGILFSLEVLLRDFRLPVLCPIAISASMGTIVGQKLEGNNLIFQTAIPGWGYGEVVFCVLLGIICGLVGALFIKFYSGTEHFFQEKIPLPRFLKPALGGLIVGILSILAPEVLGSGYGFIQTTLTEGLFWGWALSLIFIKIFATSATLGSGGLGGILAPALFMGAMTGTAFGSATHAIFPEFAPEIYAAVGMGAVAGAVMQAPLANIVMLIEFTGNHTLALPALAACVAAAYSMQIFQKHSIFIQKLLSLGINIRRNSI